MKEDTVDRPRASILGFKWIRIVLVGILLLGSMFAYVYFWFRTHGRAVNIDSVAQARKWTGINFPDPQQFACVYVKGKDLTIWVKLIFSTSDFETFVKMNNFQNYTNSDPNTIEGVLLKLFNVDHWMPEATNWNAPNFRPTVACQNPPNYWVAGPAGDLSNSLAVSIIVFK